MNTIIHSVAAVLVALPAWFCAAAIQQGEMAGHIFGRAEKVTGEFNGEDTR